MFVWTSRSSEKAMKSGTWWQGVNLFEGVISSTYSTTVYTVDNLNTKYPFHTQTYFSFLCDCVNTLYAYFRLDYNSLPKIHSCDEMMECRLSHLSFDTVDRLSPGHLCQLITTTISALQVLNSDIYKVLIMCQFKKNTVYIFPFQGRP